MARNYGEEGEVRGTSTEPGESYLDHVQHDVQATGKGPDGESMDVGGSAQHASDAENSQPVDEQHKNVELDRSAVEILEPQEVDREPKQVESTDLVFVPKKDFEARINQDKFQFRSGVQTRVSRDLAAMLTEDESRGYIKD